MVEFRRADPDSIVDEITPLLKASHDEVNIGRKATFDPAFTTYKQLDAAGCLVVYEARDSDKLVGYAIYILTERPHARGERVGILDSVYLLPEHRRRETAKKLLAFAEEGLVELGISAISAGARNEPLARWLRQQGYVYVEAYYEKELRWKQS